MEETENTLPEAPTSLTVRAFYKGYSVLVTRRGEKGDMSNLVKDATKAIDWMETQDGFAPDWNKGIPTKTAVDPNAPKCGIHGTPMILRPAGISKTTGKAYPAFWACPEKNADGSYCKYKPEQDDINA